MDPEILSFVRNRHPWAKIVVFQHPGSYPACRASPSGAETECGEGIRHGRTNQNAGKTSVDESIFLSRPSRTRHTTACADVETCKTVRAPESELAGEGVSLVAMPEEADRLALSGRSHVDTTFFAVRLVHIASGTTSVGSHTPPPSGRAPLPPDLRWTAGCKVLKSTTRWEDPYDPDSVCMQQGRLVESPRCCSLMAPRRFSPLHEGFKTDRQLASFHTRPGDLQSPT